MTARPIPIDALEAAHWLVVGTTGSGKTYLARGLFEQLRAAGRRLGAVDKLGKLWGLTVSADGAGAGLEFVIFGGKRPGAVPMRMHDGDRIGRLFVARNIPAIFDLSQWDADTQELWLADFARAVFATNAAALHLLLDEAQSWVPANGGGAAYKAVKLLAEQGRGNGINLLLTAPRLNGIDVGVRQALGGLVAMRQTSARDRAAVAELVGGHLEIDEKAFGRELPSLPTGDGFVWSPTGAGLERVSFPANATFDSSRTPRHGDAPPPPIAVSSALVDELRAALAPPAADADLDDAISGNPTAAHARGSSMGDALHERDVQIAELRLRISELEGQLADADDARATAAAMGNRATDALFAVVQFASGQFQQMAGAMRTAVLPAIEDEPPAPEVAQEPADLLPPEPAPARGPAAAEEATPGADPVAADGAIRGRKALVALVAHPGVTEQQWAWIAGLAIGGGTWSTYRSALRAAGLVWSDAGLWRPTREGIAAIGAPGDVVGPGPELARAWGGRTSGGRRIVEVLLKRSPGFITRDVLAAELRMAASGGTFSTYLSRLRRNGLLDEKGNRLRLAPALLDAR